MNESQSDKRRMKSLTCMLMLSSDRLLLLHFVQKAALMTSLLLSVLSVQHINLSIFLLWNISLPAVLFTQKGMILILTKSVDCLGCFCIILGYLKGKCNISSPAPTRKEIIQLSWIPRTEALLHNQWLPHWLCNYWLDQELRGFSVSV